MKKADNETPPAAWLKNPENRRLWEQYQLFLKERDTKNIAKAKERLKIKS